MEFLAWTPLKPTLWNSLWNTGTMLRQFFYCNYHLLSRPRVCKKLNYIARMLPLVKICNTVMLPIHLLLMSGTLG